MILVMNERRDTKNGNQYLKTTPEITFARLTAVSLAEIAEHMSDPRVAEHMPLLTSAWTLDDARKFVETKEQTWRVDGLGHWAILSDGVYIGWGGFQKENNEWDFGLVLKPTNFGLGLLISRKAIAFAKSDPRIDYITFLLPPSRKHLGALSRNSVEFIETVDYAGALFRKYRLDTK